MSSRSRCMIRVWLQENIDTSKYVLFELIYHVGWLMTFLVNTLTLLGLWVDSAMGGWFK